MNKPKVLFSMPTKHHVEIALDEMTGLQELGYPCNQFHYAAKEGHDSKIARFWIIIQNARNLIKIARKFQPDVVYFNSRLEVLAGVRDFITISMFKTFYRRKVRFVIKSHGSDLSVLQSKSPIMRQILPFLKKNVSAWLFLSSEEKKKLAQIGYFDNDKVFVAKNIVRTGQFTIDPGFKASLNIPNENKVLLFVGRIIKEKGILDVIDACAQIKNRYCTSLIIVGDGSAFDEVKKRIAQHQLDDNVVLTGFIPEQDVVRYYANSDVLVFPTYFPEGFPMALFNSVAAGLAIVTTPTRAATDFLTEPENCLWAEPENSESVANAIDKLLQSETLMAQMKGNNIRKAELFSKEQVSAELSGIIETIMKQ